MIPVLFQPEISNLESQIAQLQAQISLHQERITHLNEAESVADTAIASLQSALEKISALSSAATSALEAAVLRLFRGDDTPDGGDDGNNPPGDDGGNPIEPNSELELNGQRSEIDPDKHWQQAQPDGSAWDLASPIACLLSDAPIAAKNQYAELVRVSKAVAYMKRRDGEILAVYTGFSNKHRAKIWGEWLAVTCSIAGGFEIRPSKRLTDSKHELKLWGMSIEDIERLAKCDLTKSPPSDFGDAPRRQPLRALKILQPALLEDLEVNDIVCSLTTPAWQYRIMEIKGDILDCERLGVLPPYRIGIRIGGVALVSKVAQAKLALAELNKVAEIDPLDVPAGCLLKRTSDWMSEEYELWVCGYKNERGVPRVIQKHLGRLVQHTNGIYVYRTTSGIARTFPTTRDAIAYLVGVTGTSFDEIAAAFQQRDELARKRVARL